MGRKAGPVLYAERNSNDKIFFKRHSVGQFGADDDECSRLSETGWRDDGSVQIPLQKRGCGLRLLPELQSIVLFFSYLAWALYAVGLVVAVFECGIEYQTGQASVKDTALGAIKGFMAVGCFTLVPVELYKLAVDLQAGLTNGLTGYGSIDALATGITDALSAGNVGSIDASGVFGGLTSVITSPIMALFLIIMMGYAIVKCFFSNLKRGGILLIQIAVGSLYMFSIPRGYTDGFIQWCKQIIGLCLTTFLQATILTAGLLVLKDHALLGLGLMLSAGEVPRICGAFGLDTSTRANIMSAVYAAQTAINTTRTVIQTVAAK